MTRPAGFTLVALYCAWSAVRAVGAAFGPDGADVGGLTLLAAVFAAVAAEALWRCRPWCFRAFVAYVCVADLAWMAGVGALGDPSSDAVTGIFVSRLLVGVASILYVRSRSLRMFGPQAPRIIIPAPRP